jgi:hypothetical protein
MMHPLLWASAVLLTAVAACPGGHGEAPLAHEAEARRSLPACILEAFDPVPFMQQAIGALLARWFFFPTPKTPSSEGH